MRRICVFCGSSNGSPAPLAEAAQAVGTELAQRGLGVVYGGGSNGLMGRVAHAALAAGGEVIGVIPRALDALEPNHPPLTRLEIVDSMHERKARMVELSDGFIALPGGLGTLDELFEIWTWRQLEFHAKPIALLNTQGFFDPLLAYLDHAQTIGFIQDRHRALAIVEREPKALLNRLLAATC